LKVVDRIVESRVITSFHLEPVTPDGWEPYEPGQFLVLRVPPISGGRPVPRSYSVSWFPADTRRYRSTVKREAAPSSGLPDGVGSSWLHDRVAIGDTLMASGPRGEFRLDRASARPVVLLSGGVGLTPLVSMLHALALDTTRDVTFIHACDDGDVHALRDEVLGLQQSRRGIDLHFCYRFPTDRDRSNRTHQSEGLITAELLAPHASGGPRDFYLCGPPPFMKAVYGILRGLRVAPERIAYEFFGPATVLEQDIAAHAPSMAPAASERPLVEFRRTGRTVTWDPKAQSLLALAEEAGLAPDFSCRAGVCNTCKTAVLSGEVEYFETPLDPPENGHALICCSRPKGNVSLDL
jgi:ferredoxin-NADP reductase